MGMLQKIIEQGMGHGDLGQALTPLGSLNPDESHQVLVDAQKILNRYQVANFFLRILPVIILCVVVATCYMRRNAGIIVVGVIVTLVLLGLMLLTYRSYKVIQKKIAIVAKAVCELRGWEVADRILRWFPIKESNNRGPGMFDTGDRDLALRMVIKSLGDNISELNPDEFHLSRTAKLILWELANRFARQKDYEPEIAKFLSSVRKVEMKAFNEFWREKFDAAYESRSYSAKI